MHIELDDPRHCAEFIRLNEQWISEYFELEDADRALAAHPMKVVEDGGHILALVDAGKVVGVCALFNEGAHRFQLARMAVSRQARGKGYGDVLIKAAIEQAEKDGAHNVYLISNTVLAAAIRLYRKHGFTTGSEGVHPDYARANIVMERLFR